MNINLSAEDLMNDEVFRRLVILVVAPVVIQNSSGTTYGKAQEVYAVANSVLIELQRKQ